LLPTLAFVAGDGEIYYSATLKAAFQVHNVNMPPVVPRLSLAYVTGCTHKVTKKRAIEVDDVIKHGVNSRTIQWFTNQTTEPLDTLRDEVKKSMGDIHAPLQTYAKSISPDLAQLAKQNEQHIEQQIQFLQEKINQHIEEKYQHQISQFDEVELA